MVLDTSSKTHESEWFDAAEHWEEIRAFCKAFQGPRHLSLVSVFDASHRVLNMWKDKGHDAAAVDIQTDMAFDMTSRIGFFMTLALIMSLSPAGVAILAPPCSLFVWLSSSLHRRCLSAPLGDLNQFLVRLANVLSANTSMIVKAQLKFRYDTFTIVEQPKNSWMFKCPVWQSLQTGFLLKTTLTYQGLFGCFIEKGTHLLHNLPDDRLVARKMTKSARSKFNARLKKIKALPVYYRKKNGKVSGTKALAGTSVYPKRFAKALYNQWQACCR